MEISRDAIANLTSEVGLVLLGITDLDVEADYQRLEQWLADQKHGGLSFLEKNLDLRRFPQKLQTEACCAIVLGLPYPKPPHTNHPKVAGYAQFPDYHKVIKQRARIILAKLQEQYPHTNPSQKARVVTDSAPVLERALAAKAVAGFIGKNTMYIHPTMGSFILLGVILCGFPLPIDQKVAVSPHRRSSLGGCGTCRRCQVHCPTGALDRDYVLDARKCLSYWSIEHRGSIPINFWPHFKDYFFGCDICQRVCPYNRAPVLLESVSPLVKRIDELSIQLPLIANMNQKEYESWFGGTPMTRAKKVGLQRNALISMIVTDHPDTKATIDGLLDSPDLDTVLLETINQAKHVYWV